MVPAVSVEAYDAARHRVASIDRSSRGRIVVSGPDRASYLQGLLTNDIAALKPGLGCYAAYLTAHGRMIADMNVYELGDVILLTMEGDTKDTVVSKPAYRGSIATWTRRRFRSRQESSRARSASRKAVTSGRRL